MKTSQLFFDHEHFYELEFFDERERKVKKKIVTKDFKSFRGAKNEAIDILRNNPSFSFAVINLLLFYIDVQISGRCVAKLEILPDGTPAVSEHDIELLIREGICTEIPMRLDYSRRFNIF